MADLSKIPPEPELPYRNVIPELEHHATAIGYVCFAWADLEVSVDLFIEAVLGCSEDAARAVATSAGQFSRRCVLLYQIVSEKPPSAEWLTAFGSMLGEFQKALAEDRNRIVHDPWTERPKPRQWNYSARTGHPEAGAPKSMLPIKANDRELEWVWTLERRIKRAAACCNLAREDYMIWRETGRQPEFPQLSNQPDSQSPPGD